MKRAGILRGVVCIVFLLVLRISVTGAAPNAPLLTISPSDGSTNSLPLLPVVLTIELRNDSDTTLPLEAACLGVTESPTLGARYLYCFRIQAPDGATEEAYLSDWVNWQIDASAMVKAQKPLGPRRRQALDYCLGFGVRRLLGPAAGYSDLRREAMPLFTAPGPYRIRLTIAEGLPGALQSNVLAFQIDRPETPEDLLAYRIISGSRWPEALLTPLSMGAMPQGIPVLISAREFADAGSTSPLEVCRQVLARAPSSHYAPYARVFLGTAMTLGWGERPDVPSSGTVAVERRLEGIRTLRQAAENLALARRWREITLLKLRRGAQALSFDLQASVADRLGTLDTILGGTRVDLRGTAPILIFRAAHELTQGTAPPGVAGLLHDRFTDDQIKVIQAAMESNPALQQAVGVSPLQIELEQHTAWADAELRKIPWRDPVTGQLTMAGLPSSGR